LMPYSMWQGNTSITVIAKRDTLAGNVRVNVPVDNMGMSSYKYFNVTDLMANTVSLHPRADVVTTGLTFNVGLYGVVPLKLSAVPLTSNGIGWVDSVTSNGDGSFAIKGWACSAGVDTPVSLKLYVGGSSIGSAGDQYYSSGTANLPSEPAVATACQGAGTKYRYNLTLGTNAVQSFSGQPFYVEVQSPVGNSNNAIYNANSLKIPLYITSPTIVVAQCSQNRTSVTLSWAPSTNATNYYPRVGMFPTSCPTGWSNDGNECYIGDVWGRTGGITTTSITYSPIVPGKAYTTWVHAGNSSNADTSVHLNNFTC
ncbi:MAG: hypothetical protein ACREGC_03830, partial [Minisyncoccia bacterium]